MFRNMLKSKEQRRQDEMLFNKRVFPLGEQQRALVHEMVLRITKKCTDDPMVFYYYLVAFDHYLKEHGQNLTDSLKNLESIKPKITPEVKKELLALMQLTIKMQDLADFPSEKIILEVSREM